ncbi:Importin alpha subunit (Karyopherin alpha subunit) (Serine-rich RNA polymerase I suppressor protein) [Tulasnella sp. 408]|nr:Importin alpha subunit (Karyopherin alpha subunit) (Serine-rich RNA polymerase I suppressor protein) [Tulasnella sp. 408]
MENAAESALQNQRDDEVQGQEDSVSEVKTEKELEESELRSYITSDLHIVPEIVSGIHSADREVRLAATVTVRRVMQELMKLAKQLLVNSGLIEPVVGMLSFDDLELCAEAARILINFTAGSVSDSEVDVVVATGAIPKLIALLPCESTDVMENALWALANIAGQSRHIRDVIIQEGGVKPVLDILDTPEKYELKVVTVATHALDSYLNPRWDQKLGYEVTRPMIPVLIRFINSTADKTLESFADVLRCLDHISANKTAAEAIIATGITPRLVEICAIGNDKLRPRAIHCLEQFVSHSELSIDAPIQAGFLTVLKSCINCEHVDTRRAACCAASTIAAGSLSQAQSLFDSDLISLVFHAISSQEEDTKTRHDAAWVLLNLTDKGRDHNELLGKLARANCMEAISVGLSSLHRPTLRKLFRALENMTDTKWSGQEEALERFQVTGGASRLAAIKFGSETSGTLIGQMAENLLRSHFQAFDKRPRV